MFYSSKARQPDHAVEGGKDINLWGFFCAYAVNLPLEAAKCWLLKLINYNTCVITIITYYNNENNNNNK